MARKMLGQYIVADSEICHGKPTFAGTQIMVSRVLEMVAAGMDWDTIVRECQDSITKEGIAAALNLAQQVFIAYAPKYAEKHAPVV